MTEDENNYGVPEQLIEDINMEQDNVQLRLGESCIHFCTEDVSFTIERDLYEANHEIIRHIANLCDELRSITRKSDSIVLMDIINQDLPGTMETRMKMPEGSDKVL